MVDPKNTNERTVEAVTDVDHGARKAWVMPRLDVASFQETEATGPAAGNDGGHSVS